MTRAQKKHARTERAVLRLRRAAARYSTATNATSEKGSDAEPADIDTVAFAFADLVGACDAYAETLTSVELRKLLRRAR